MRSISLCLAITLFSISGLSAPLIPTSEGQLEDRAPTTSFSFKRDEEKREPTTSFSFKRDEEKREPTTSFSFKRDEEKREPTTSFSF
ncbi:uncharacterized protein PgNI_06758 [Pyricularia grisea]|uniref:Uncharacterized protein n=1 Tax=Pyricularia grisea TaxID=148305 RepID=A0A6P8B2Y9_PYRGI|nr:uncharacterized protein PgNI_06758 [Pyricularia grisea]TLD09217.1 hypothetical protein PgNI_06758 [Pyricularia grisea]